jgi:sugar phosphate isomerase/epimerase
VSLRFGYITNGLGDHRLDDALELLADHGYDAVALTLDHHHLDPYAPGLAGRVAALGDRLAALGLAVTIETGARYLLDPRRKHQPNLLSDEGRERRIDFYERAIAIAADLGAEVVSLWSGIAPDGIDPAEADCRLLDGCARVLAAAERAQVQLGFEPEPGMLVDRIEAWERLHRTLGNPARLGLTLDLGHCVCLEPQPVGECVRRGAPHLVNVHIEDMRRGAHDHLDFGEGELDVPAALAALTEVGYGGVVSVELSRHSHTAHTAVPRAIRVLREAARQPATVGRTS